MTKETYIVSGMTCAHCVSAVTSEVSALHGVHEVTVGLVPGGESSLTVVSDVPLPEDAVRQAVNEAGYELAGVAT